MATPSSYPQFQQVNAAGEVIDGGGGAAGSSTTEVLLADIKAATLALAPLIDGLELITGNIKIDTAAVSLNTDDVESILSALAIDVVALKTNVEAMVARSAPLVFDATDRQEPQSGNYVLAADPDRRAVWVLNNTGEQNGRGAATLFIRHDGTPDRFDHQQWVLPGEGAWVNSPALDLEIYAEGVNGLNGAYTVTRYL
jgi:hypothetical protein